MMHIDFALDSPRPQNEQSLRKIVQSMDNGLKEEVAS